MKLDASESVVYVFRDRSEISQSRAQLRGLDSKATYHVVSLNDRPGREQTVAADSLMKGISMQLLDVWLAQGDGNYGAEFADQLRYGLDILLLKRVP